jgi:hypothetical protein
MEEKTGYLPYSLIFQQTVILYRLSYRLEAATQSVVNLLLKFEIALRTMLPWFAIPEQRTGIAASYQVGIPVVAMVGIKYKLRKDISYLHQHLEPC